VNASRSLLVSSLDNTPHPYDHPFGTYVRHLRSGTSVSWFSRTAGVENLRDHLWALMGLRDQNVRHSPEGFARTTAGTVLFIAGTSEHGSVITCFPLNNRGVASLNQALADEQQRTDGELQHGTFVGNLGDGTHAHHAVVERGVDVSDSGVFDYINGATIARLDG
jgi:hypothetical protein